MLLLVRNHFAEAEQVWAQQAHCRGKEWNCFSIFAVVSFWLFLSIFSKLLITILVNCCAFWNPFCQNYTFDIEKKNEHCFDELFLYLVMTVFSSALTVFRIQDHTQSSKSNHKWVQRNRFGSASSCSRMSTQHFFWFVFALVLELLWPSLYKLSSY